MTLTELLKNLEESRHDITHTFDSDTIDIDEFLKFIHKQFGTNDTIDEVIGEYLSRRKNG